VINKGIGKKLSMKKKGKTVMIINHKPTIVGFFYEIEETMHEEDPHLIFRLAAAVSKEK
jgi:hypothetical protein